MSLTSNQKIEAIARYAESLCADDESAFVITLIDEQGTWVMHNIAIGLNLAIQKLVEAIKVGKSEVRIRHPEGHA